MFAWCFYTNYLPVQVNKYLLETKIVPSDIINRKSKSNTRL